MSKHTFSIRIAICLLGFLVLIVGCQNQAGEVEKPATTVVSQKISNETQTVAPQTPKATAVAVSPEPPRRLVETPNDPAETKQSPAPARNV